MSSWECPSEAWEQELSLRERVLHWTLLAGLPRGVARLKLRSVALCLIASRRLLKGSGAKRRTYALDAALDRTVICSIDLDIPRTAGGDPELDACLGLTRALLLRCAAEDATLGYCQGMNNVAALFAASTPCQEDAYVRFRGFVRSLRDLWLPGFPLLDVGIEKFEALAGSRPWFQHLRSLGIGPELYLPRVWMSFFAMSLPLEQRKQLIRQLEGAGLAGLLAGTLALFDHQEAQLLRQEDQEDALDALRGLQDHAPESVALLAVAGAWLPAAVTMAALPPRTSNRNPALRRQGSRVLDRRGREALHAVGVTRRLSALFADRRASTSRPLRRARRP